MLAAQCFRLFFVVCFVRFGGVSLGRSLIFSVLEVPQNVSLQVWGSPWAPPSRISLLLPVPVLVCYNIYVLEFPLVWILAFGSKEVSIILIWP